MNHAGDSDSLREGDALRAGECPLCDALFVVPTADAAEVVCPGCGREVSVASTRVRELLTARPASVAAEPESPGDPETPTLDPSSIVDASAPVSDVAETDAADPAAISDLGALLGAVGMGVHDARVERRLDAQLPETLVDSESNATGLLSETLGLARLPSVPLDDSANETADGTETAAPSFEGETPTDDGVLVEDPGECDSGLPFAGDASAGTTSAPPADDTKIFADPSGDGLGEPLDWAPPVVAEGRRRRWLTPALATCGLLAIGAPIGYVAWQSANAPSPLVSTSGVAARESREALLAEADAAGRSAAETPSIAADLNTETPDAGAAPGGEVVAAAAASSEPFDTAVEPASFEQEAAEIYGDRYASSAAPADSEHGEMLDEIVGGGATALLPVAESPLLGAPRYGVDDLVEATSLAVSAGDAFVRGTLDSDRAASEMGRHYARLCYLAQVLTLLDTDTFDLNATTVQLEATDVFRQMFRDAGAREDSRQIARHWIAWDGRPHGGVFFVGAPDESIRAGDVFEYRFPTADGDAIHVVTEQRLDPKRYRLAGARQVGVMGVVVEDPHASIRGYDGEDRRVVWARKTLPLRRLAD